MLSRSFCLHTLKKNSSSHATRPGVGPLSLYYRLAEGYSKSQAGKTGMRRRVVGGATIPRNWTTVLRVDENKTQLFDSFWLADKQLVITKGGDVLSKPPLLETSVLAPCNHKEAESLIMLHATHAAHNGHKKILICTVDTDLVVMVVALAHTLKEETEMGPE